MKASRSFSMYFPLFLILFFSNLLPLSAGAPLSHTPGKSSINIHNDENVQLYDLHHQHPLTAQQHQPVKQPHQYSNKEPAPRPAPHGTFLQQLHTIDTGTDTDTDTDTDSNTDTQSTYLSSYLQSLHHAQLHTAYLLRSVFTLALFAVILLIPVSVVIVQLVERVWARQRETRVDGAARTVSNNGAAREKDPEPGLSMVGSEAGFS